MRALVISLLLAFSARRVSRREALLADNGSGLEGGRGQETAAAQDDVSGQSSKRRKHVARDRTLQKRGATTLAGRNEKNRIYSKSNDPCKNPDPEKSSF